MAIFYLEDKDGNQAKIVDRYLLVSGNVSSTPAAGTQAVSGTVTAIPTGTQGISGSISGIITQTVEPTYLGNFKASRVTAVSGAASGITGLAGFSALTSVKSSIIKNPSSSQSVYIGESGITTSTGWKLGPGEALTFYNLNNLFVIADTNQSQELMILQSA